MDTASVSSMDINKTPADLWGGNAAISNSGWGDAVGGALNKCEGGSGWGSPSPSPNPNAGTDSWGTTKQVQPQAWGASTDGPSSAPITTDWGVSGDIKTSAVSSVGSIGWSQPSLSSQAPGSNWGDNESKSSDAGSWGSQADLTTHNSVWAQSDVSSTSSSAITSILPSEETANYTTAPRPISASWSSERSSTQQQTTPQGAWVAGSPFNNKSQCSWPAGRPLTNDMQIAAGPPTSDVELAREKLIAAAVNTQDGWGAQPVRQDTDWSTEEAAVPPPLTRRRNSSEDDNNWVQSNSNGTAIWESKQDVPPKDWQRSHSRSSSTSSGGANEWNSVQGGSNDANNYSGARDASEWARGVQPSQQQQPQWITKPDVANWDRPALPRAMSNESSWVDRGVDPNQRIDLNRMEQNQRAIAGTCPAPSPVPGQWRPKPDGNMWPGNEQKSTDDNMWDRDGTHVWGKTETGSWPNKLQQRPVTGNNGQFLNEHNSGPSPTPRTWEGHPNHMGAPRPGEPARNWPDGQSFPQAAAKKWPEEPSAQWISQHPPPAANSSTWVNPTPPPNPNISMDGTHIWKQKAAVSITILRGYYNLGL